MSRHPASQPTHLEELSAELRIMSAVLPEECFALVRVEVSKREKDGFG